MSIRLNSVLSAFLVLVFAGCTGKNYLSPGSIVADSRSGKLYTALTGTNRVAVTSLTDHTTASFSIEGSPNRLLLAADGQRLYVSYGDQEGGVAVVDLQTHEILATIPVGPSPEGMALSPDGTQLYVALRYWGQVAVVDLLKGDVSHTIAVGREPRSVATDGTNIVVGCFLPDGEATDPGIAARIAIIDSGADTIRFSVPLPPGAHSVQEVAVNGNFAYASHVLSRFYLPVTQLDRGWVNANAISIIDLTTGKLTATVLLDDVDSGAANLTGIYADNRMLYVLSAGGNELIAIDRIALHRKLEQNEGKDVSSDLSFTAGIKQRVPLQGVSPRFLACDGENLYVSSRFSPSVDVVLKTTLSVTDPIVLGKEPSLTKERMGEIYFFSAEICYQRWQSCASCHPDARVDGLNWDLQNDGLGNPKNTKSMLYSHKTPPCMITGIRADAQIAVRKGILHTLGTEQPESVAEAIDAYLLSLTPLPSPFLKNGKLSEAAERGKVLYEACGCQSCHNGPYFTDGKSYFVGMADAEPESIPFDTPTLREVWRTAPYLYDGRAATVKAIFTTHNADDLHGSTTQLTEAELDDLTEYVLSL